MRSVACCLILTVWAVGAAAEGDATVSRLERRYRGATSLQASFLERYREGGRTTRVEAGTVSFRRPGKMRWEYESPEPKLFVSDGRTVWFYVPGDRTVMRARAEEDADWRMPFALLTRDPSMRKLCSRIARETNAEPSASGQALLRCTLKDQATGISEVLIGVDALTGDIGQVVLRQPGGVQIEFTFSGWKLNPPLPEREFRFAVPAGVAIVEGPESLAMPGH